jgi:DUF971 family protein
MIVRFANVLRLGGLPAKLTVPQPASVRERRIRPLVARKFKRILRIVVLLRPTPVPPYYRPQRVILSMKGGPMEPREIVADRAAGTLTVVWTDGHVSMYSMPDLRWACPCATCSGEWGRPGVLAGVDRLPDEEFVLSDVHAVGAYAIAPTWASGHSTGIYSFEYLRSICPCESCRAINS